MPFASEATPLSTADDLHADPYSSVFPAPGPTTIGSFAPPYAGNEPTVATFEWNCCPPSKQRQGGSKGTVVLVHGLGSHLGRWNHVADFFVTSGYKVVGSDLILHGRSEPMDGASGNLRSIDDMVSVWSQYILSEVAPTPGPHFLYAHSAGGLVAFLALDRGLQDTWTSLESVVYSAPLFGSLDALAKVAYVIPRCLLCCTRCCTQVQLPGIQKGQLSNYEAAEAATRADPLYWGWKINLSFARAVLVGTLAAQSKFDKVSYPFLILHSLSDQLTDPAVSRQLFERAPSKRKALENDAFAGRQHELHNDKMWKTPLEFAIKWYANDR